MSILKISHPTRKINTRIRIPGSKSESNRALILNALSGNRLKLDGLSTSRDTQRLIQLLASDNDTIDVLDAGTSMRFLTAYYCATGQHKIVTGTERMLQRPIEPLVNALTELGFNIRYLGQQGFPPVEVLPVGLQKINNEAHITGEISSQFITALLLVAPFLSNGLTLNFTTGLTSKPYIEMTLKILKHFGVKHQWNNDTITILPAKLEGHFYEVGADWSSASYWYIVAFLADEAEIFIEGLKDDWGQGDRIIADWMARFGVATEFTTEGALLKKVSSEYPRMMKINFKDNPDLAQSFAALFAAGGVYGTLSGIESLKIKETDRIAALKNELSKMNVHFEYSEMYEFYQVKGQLQLPVVPIQTYNDHRMAMSFAPLGLLGPIEIEAPEVVSKSYPTFWDDLLKAGFNIEG